MSLLGKLFRASLRLKIVLPISLIIAVSLLLISGYLIDRQSAGYIQELEASGRTMLRMLAINAESGVLFGNKYELDELLKTPAQFESVKYVVISNTDGATLAELHESTMVTAGLHRKSSNSPVHDSIAVELSNGSDGEEYLVLSMPVVTFKQAFSTENLGITGGLDAATEREVIGHIELGLSLDKVNQAIFEAKFAAYLFTLVVLVGTILLLAFIVGAITRPVRVLVDVTDQVSKGDLTQRVNITQRDEIGHLADTFNRMIESLKQSRDEVEQYNRNLEEKIIERTLQLEEAQAQLIQSEKMSAIGQLAAGVAHELNNPLGGILGYAQFTLEKLNKNIPEKTTAKEIQSYIRYVSDIETQARRCKTIVQNLLKFSRSSRTVDFADVDVNKAIEETLSFVAHQLHLSQIELDVQLDPKLPHIQGNIGQLQQVFTNLIINAMHASKPGALIVITSRYSPALGEFGGAVELMFKDHGHGIKDENLKKIFEPFFTTKEIGKGTGLGLSVSYGIVKEHGGEITVTSEVGAGSTFTVVLPVQKPETDSDNRKEANYSFGQ
ncbi:MAG: ATP-binding protein [candidate division Zixibacteria bacterium]|nr:ATP-binding protein [candidate division Zixibacteria bacterium]